MDVQSAGPHADLQRVANARYGLTATQTLAAAQTLYEAGLLSYPRTDSRHVTPEVAGTFPDRLRAVAAGFSVPLRGVAQRLAGGPPDPGKRVVDASRVTDHHALLPFVFDTPAPAKRRGACQRGGAAPYASAAASSRSTTHSTPIRATGGAPGRPARAHAAPKASAAIRAASGARAA